MFANNYSTFISPPYLRIGTAIREASRGASPESNRDKRAFVGRKQPTQASNGFPNKREAYSVHSYRAIFIILRMRREMLHCRMMRPPEGISGAYFAFVRTWSFAGCPASELLSGHREYFQPRCPIVSGRTLGHAMLIIEVKLYPIEKTVHSSKRCAPGVLRQGR